MKSHAGWALSAAVVLAQVPAMAELQNVQIGGYAPQVASVPSREHLAWPRLEVPLPYLERFALAEDRAEVLEELVPGTEDYFYFNCLYAQEQGDFERVETLLKSWIDRHGEGGGGVQEIRNRQALLRFPSAPQETLAYLINRFGLSFDHQRQLPGAAPDLPTSLDPALISRERLLRRVQANRDTRNTVSAFHPHAYSWLIATDLSDLQLRSLLEELRLPDYPRLPELVARDLAAPNSGGFGSMMIHGLLVREQLDALLHLKPELLDSDAFIETYVRRLLPGYDDPNWARNPALMAAYLDRLQEFAQRLAPAQSSLKAHVQYHRLAFDQSQGVYDKDRFLAYIQIPRRMVYVNPEFLEKGNNSRFTADLAQEFGTVTSLPRVGSDEELVTEYLRHFFASGTGMEAYTPYLRERYLRRIYAETKLLQGEGDLEQWYAWLDPGAVDALKNRVDVAFVPENKARFDLDEKVSLDVWVKNVDRLLVKVFEIDTKSYYQAFNQPITTAIDLDGLVANQEQVHTYSEAPLRRIRREFTFPELTGRGVWVIEFVGNGTSSRAVVAKGGLQYLDRTGPAGQRFTVFDEGGEKVPNASIWYSGRNYPADDKGEITLPFSTEPGSRKFLLCEGEFASLADFNAVGEAYRLTAGFHIDRESIRSGQMAEVAIRPLLYLNGAAVPLDILQNPALDIRSRTHDGIESSQRIDSLTLKNNELVIQPFRVPENLTSISFSLSGTVEKLSGGEPESLNVHDVVTVNGVHAKSQTASLFLTREGAQYALELRDLSGNPLAERAVTLELHPRDFVEVVAVQLKTDSQGVVALGALAETSSLVAHVSGVAPAHWDLEEPGYSYPGTLHGSTETPLYLPFVGDAPSRVADGASLLEVRWGAYVADHTEALRLADGYLTVSGVPAGDYLLHLKDGGEQIKIRVTEAGGGDRYLASKSRLLDGSAPTPLQIQAVEANDTSVSIKVGGANAMTRVHVVGTRFLPEHLLYEGLDVTTPPDTPARAVERGYALYASGRQIGDEYRYILERRFATIYPGNMLERPSLLLNPWAIEDTEASQEAAMMGEAMDSMAPPATPPAPERSSGERARREKSMEAGEVSPSLDFLDNGRAVFYNLEPNAEGFVTIPTVDLQGRGYLQIVAADPLATVSRLAALPTSDWTPRDLRLANGLDPESHVVEQKRVQVLASGETLSVSLTGDADVQVYDSVPSVLGLLSTLNRDPKLKEFGFVGRWPALSAAEKHEKFTEYTSHELNLFLYHKDREFFDAVVRPYLANKYEKTFIDHWLLEDDLGLYLEPWRLAQLNVVEKILLAKRVEAGRQAVASHVRDGVDLIAPDPERANQLFMTALYGGALSGGGFGGGGGGGGFGGGGLQNVEIDGAIRVRGNFYDNDDNLSVAGNGGFGRALGDSAPSERPDRLGVEVKEMEQAIVALDADGDGVQRYIEESKSLPEGADAKGIKNYVFATPESVDQVSLFQNELRDRGRYQALYRATEKTEALVETDYYKVPITLAHPAFIPVNAFWLDYVEATPGTAFLSPQLVEAASTYTEALLALAVLDLPFESPKHTIKSEGGSYTITAGGAAIAFYKDIEVAESDTGETPVLVSQNYFSQVDRFRYEGNQRFDKFVTEEFLTGVVYGCQMTVTNPTSTPHQIEVLRQIPTGALPVWSGRYTKSERLFLDAYNTTRLEYLFYFPAPGNFTHYPVHVSKNGTLLASAEAQPMSVVNEPSQADTTSWQYVSQQAPSGEVIDYLREANLNRIDLNQILWRMKEEAFYRDVLTLLNARIHYAPELWSYALHHGDKEAIRTYLRYREDFVAEAGPCLESELLTIEPVERKFYQHIEYAPLINPRAHHPQGKWMITNGKFEQQYRAMMNVLAHRPSMRPSDLLALTYYLLLQDRVDEAMAFFARVDGEALPSRIQYDYLDAYLAFYREDPAAAAVIAAKYTDYPVERWQTRFADVAAQAAEIAGAGSAPTDGRPDQNALAAQEPRLDLEVKDDGLTIYYDNMASCEVSFYPIDLEMLFTRSPFAMAGSNVFAGVKPAATATITFSSEKTQMEMALPPEFVSRHVVVKVESGGISRTDIRYASNLVAQLVERYGQVQVTGKVDGKPLPKVYVKVFAQLHNGQELFYRDGYTDLRGRFDYASSSTMDVGDVKEFSILVISEEHGAKVQTVAPPGR